MALATSEDLIARHDIDVIGDLATDTRERLSREAIVNSPVVEVALCDASGDVESALREGNRYTLSQINDLANTTNPTYTNQRSKLKRIVCDLAMNYLFMRRGSKRHSEKAEEYETKARAHLKRLKSGEDIFGLDIDDRAENSVPTTAGPTSVDYCTMNLLPTRMHRNFPNDKQRLPTDRG